MVDLVPKEKEFYIREKRRERARERVRDRDRERKKARESRGREMKARWEDW